MQEPSVIQIVQVLVDEPGIETAKKITHFEIPAHVRDRVQLLGEKSNAGTLSIEERRDYESIIAFGNMLALMKSSATLLLKQTD